MWRIIVLAAQFLTSTIKTNSKLTGLEADRVLADFDGKICSTSKNSQAEHMDRALESEYSPGPY